MRKREFLKKAGLLSASMLVVPSLGLWKQIVSMLNIWSPETTGSGDSDETCYRQRSCRIPA